MTPAFIGPASQTKVLFVFRRKRTERQQLYRAGQGPDEMLYGLPYCSTLGFDASFVEGDEGSPTLLQRLWRPFESWLARRIGIGFALYLAVENLSLFRQADIIVSTVDTCGLPLALLKRCRILRTPLLYISQGLTNRLEEPCGAGRRHRMLRRVYSRLLASVERILVLGAGAVEPIERVFQVSPQKIYFIPFGIDTSFWSPAADTAAGDYLLSVGNDPARDYNTLLGAAGHVSLRIVTSLPVAQQASDSRVTVGSGYTDLELRELYRNAKCIVVPLKNVSQPSGQSVTLQAMACGKAVILTKTTGLWDPAHMQHLHNCYLVAPGDAAELKKAIAYLNEHPEAAAKIGKQARLTVEQFYSSARFAAHLGQHMQEVLHAAGRT